MKFGSKRIVCGAIGGAAVWLLSVAFVGGQAPQTGAPTAAQGQMRAEQVFKNVTVLRGIPVDEFMGTMGFFSSARLFVRRLSYGFIQRLGELREGREPPQDDGPSDGHDDAGHQQAVLRRPAGGHVLQLPSRPQPAEGDCEPQHPVRHAAAR